MKKDEIIGKLKENKKKTTIIAVVALLLLGGGGYAIYSTTNQPNGSNNEVANGTKSDGKTDKGTTDKETGDKDSKPDNKDNSSKDTNSNTSSSNENEKKDTSTSTDNYNNSVNSSSGNTGSTGGGSSSTPEKPAAPEKPSSGGGNSKPQAPSHTHSWTEVYKTVNHAEEGHNEQYVIKDAWTESTPITEMREHMFCSGCHNDITGWSESQIISHKNYHMDRGEKSGWYSNWQEDVVGYDTINHPAEYGTRWVVDKAAWSEQVLDYYKCSCGETK